MSETAGLDRIDRAVINAYQGGFPVVEEPFGPAAAALRNRGVEITAGELLDRVRTLEENGTLTRFGALINAAAIGGAATLVAMHAPEDRFEEIKEQVNGHREVAHNYRREHPHLNMWFVVSVADSDTIGRVLGEIEAETGQETYNLPKRQEFRVEAKFYLEGPIPDGDVDRSDLGPTVEPTESETLTPDERDLVVEIQDGLPVTATPYADVAERLGVDTGWVLRTMKRFDAEGKVRRVGVIPNHYALGYTENGMTVWDVPDELLDAVGPEVASLPFVTHCYERPRHEGVWPYNFFAMTHGRSEAESERRIGRIEAVMEEHFEVDGDDWATLFSTEILKKTGIRLGERAEANTGER
ncbi:Lrp/AsnC family transcriptional regulator [Natronomonas sp. F2-12]|jgi:DNA-binding Lrp family transcriptional regulator|uniref:siroheme decarboxylase n=1 Tax=Natronomonas aquatica TaxID=2841590 RepID=A0A9R1D6S3_9EURY|nr:Lrp/AsnC family transcriptional regulator [Natronomonas aquatica]MCQ4333793.1 Lrp/AsnC family transcriptional regulator [Natronomonas aquatica]